MIKNGIQKVIAIFGILCLTLVMFNSMQVNASSSYQQRNTYTLNKNLNVRASDSSSSHKYGVLKKGSKLIIMSTDCKNGYVKVYPITYSSSSKCYKRYGQFAASLGRYMPVYVLKSGINLVLPLHPASFPFGGEG